MSGSFVIVDRNVPTMLLSAEVCPEQRHRGSHCTADSQSHTVYAPQTELRRKIHCGCRSEDCPTSPWLADGHLEELAPAANRGRPLSFMLTELHRARNCLLLFLRDMETGMCLVASPHIKAPFPRRTFQGVCCSCDSGLQSISNSGLIVRGRH